MSRHRLDRGPVTALLGPTNTGKTHRALERMLAHPTGMIGLPLRLLAREVYERLCAARGEDAVALVTGEERRIPANPRYWACTVESMPEKAVSFLAVDEVQLAADPARGHAFTDRLLRARGVAETYFLGSETVEPLLSRLIPDARVERAPRLSRLAYAGPKRIERLPKRTAIVAFSANDVYRIAERVRSAHGGTAVVLGSLSPRARNAQIAMYQAGEVNHLVATDAIGMGLNLDIDHVAFERIRKFDGRNNRELTAAEVGQIAGRAGRHTRDGSFGGTSELGELPDHLVQAVLDQAYPPVQALLWRSADLDFSSPDALVLSLEAPPRSRFLVRQRDADDQKFLERLLAAPEVARRAVGADRVRLLWQVACIPDFARDLSVRHLDLLEAVYVLLCDGGRLPEEFCVRRLEALDRPEGEIDLLMVRLAQVRTWTYLSNRRTGTEPWLPDADGFGARAREIEDRLSDALHEALTRRFVDVRAIAVSRPETGDVTLHGDEVRVAGARVGVLRGFSFVPDADARSLGTKLVSVVSRSLAHEIERRVQACVDAPFEAFQLHSGPDGLVIGWGGPLAALVPGPDALSPKVRVLRQDLLHAGQAARITTRLDGWLAVHAERIRSVDPGDLPRDTGTAVHRLVLALGTLPVEAIDDLEVDRAALGRAGIRVGRRYLWSERLLLSGYLPSRALLWAIAAERREIPDLPPPGAPSAPLAGPRGLYEAIGFVPAGKRAYRVDLLEAALSDLAKNRRPFEVPERWGRELDATRDELEAALLANGFRRHWDGRLLAPGVVPQQQVKRVQFGR